MSTSRTQSTESFAGCHKLKKELRTSVGEQDADGKTFLVGWQNLSNPTDDPPIVFCLARVVDSVHQASVGEQDADGKLVCCDWALVVGSVRREGCVVDSVHQASVGEQDAGDKPVCCSPSEAWWTESNTRLKLDKNPSSDHEDPSSDDDDDDLYG